MSDKSRQAFEAYLRTADTFYEEALRRKQSGEYIAWVVESGWIVWQARDAEIAALKAQVERLDSLCNDYIEEKVKLTAQVSSLKARIKELEFDALTKAPLLDVNAICNERDQALARLAVEFDAAADDAEWPPSHPIFNLAKDNDTLRMALATANARAEHLASENVRLRDTLLSLKRGHLTCEDGWYSCPLSSDGCLDERQTGCTCGAEKTNAIIDEALAANKVHP